MGAAHGLYGLAYVFTTFHYVFFGEYNTDFSLGIPDLYRVYLYKKEKQIKRKYHE